MADNLKCIFLAENISNLIQILLEFIPHLSVNNSHEQMLTKFTAVYMRHSIGLDKLNVLLCLTHQVTKYFPRSQ